MKDKQYQKNRQSYPSNERAGKESTGKGYGEKRGGGRYESFRGGKDMPRRSGGYQHRARRNDKEPSFARADDEWETEGAENGAESMPPQLIVGRNAVAELLRTDRAIDKLYVRKEGDRTGSISVIVAEALAKGIPVVEIEGSKLDLMARGVAHQGVIASAAAKEYCTVDDIFAIAEERGEKPLIVMADGIADPQNLGTLIRVCECAGVHGLILPKRHAVGLTEVVAKASAGAIAHLAVAKVTNLAQTVDEMKKRGVWVFAAEAGGTSYDACDMNCPTLIIMGSEGFGVSRLLREKSDYQISIPMYGKVNSLNVSTAAAIIIHEAARQCRRGNR